MITPHPYFNLFKELNHILGPIFMDGVSQAKDLSQVVQSAIPLFEIACFNISIW